MKKDLAYRAILIASMSLLNAINTSLIVVIPSVLAFIIWGLLGATELYEAKTGKQSMSWYSCPGFFWIRLLGKGFLIKNTNIYPPLFSERKGLTGVRVGKYLIRRLA